MNLFARSHRVFEELFRCKYGKLRLCGMLTKSIPQEKVLLQPGNRILSFGRPSHRISSCAEDVRIIQAVHRHYRKLPRNTVVGEEASAPLSPPIGPKRTISPLSPVRSNDLARERKRRSKQPCLSSPQSTHVPAGRPCLGPGLAQRRGPARPSPR